MELTLHFQVGGICVRVSAFPETRMAASERCQSEGAYLLEVTNDTMGPALLNFTKEKSRLFKHYQGLDRFWIGGHYVDREWEWAHSKIPFRAFTDWEGGVNSKY